jgi:hypothetical protein
MPIVLGSVPDTLTVSLAYGGDFLQTLEAPFNWDVGVAIELHFSTNPDDPTGAFVWPATITGVFATWDVVAATVGMVLNAGAVYARLVYTDASGDVMVWATGRVNAI